MSRIRRPAEIAVLALSLAVTACSAPATKTADPSVRAQPVPAVTAPPSTAPPVDTAAPDRSTTTTTMPGPVLEPPQAPDPVEIAGAALDAPLGDLRAVGEESRLLAILEFRLAEINPVIQSLVWDHLAAGDQRVLVASIYPYSELRGDPTLPRAMADLIAGEDTAPVPVEGDGFDLVEIELEDAWWYLWANHTHILLTGGPRDLARSRMAALAAFNADEYLWTAGDCIAIATADGLGLPYSPYGEEVVVPCDQPHQWEVLAADGAAFGDNPGASMPEPDEVYAGTSEACETGFAELVGGTPFDSSLELVHYMPDALEWERGDRYTACVATVTREAEPTLVDRSFRGEGVAMAVERVAGDCHAWTVREDRVDCEHPHDFEYLGEVTSNAGTWPGRNLRHPLSACEPLLEAAASAEEVDGATLGTYATVTGPVAWSNGDRRIACFAVAEQSGSPVRIAGSIGDAWEPAGAPGDGLTA